MPLYTIVTSGPLLKRRYPDLDAAAAYAATMHVAKRGWTVRIDECTTSRGAEARRIVVLNSRGKAQRGFGKLVLAP